MIKRRSIVIVVSMVGLLFPVEYAFSQEGYQGGPSVLSFVSGDAVTVEGNESDQRGWMLGNQGQKCFQSGYKQADRDSANPIKVSQASINSREKFNEHSSIELEVNAHAESKQNSTAWYKVAVSALESGGKKQLSVLASASIFHGFAMKIDPRNFAVPDHGIVFEQFWQGSPFHPPIALTMEKADASLNQPSTSEQKIGDRFVLSIADDADGAIGKDSQPRQIDLGPVRLGEWLRWVVEVKPSPGSPDGAVRVWLNDKLIADIQNIQVGYSPGRMFAGHHPSKYFESVDVSVYRENGNSHQKVFFDDIRLATSLRAAAPKTGYNSEATCN